MAATKRTKNSVDGAPRRVVCIVAVAMLAISTTLGPPVPGRAAEHSTMHEGEKRPEGKPFRKLEVALRTFKKVLGRAYHDLAGLMRTAQRQFRTKKHCLSVKTLGAFVRRAKKLRRNKQVKARLKLLERASAVQEKIVRSRAGAGACGIPAPRFMVDAQIQPAQPSLLPLEDGGERPLARLVDEDGHGADFVVNEVILTTGDEAELGDFLSRWNGTVLSTTDPDDALSDRPAVHLVRIEPSTSDAGDLSTNVRRLDPLSRGDVRVSSDAGRHLLAAAASEAANGVNVGINWVAKPAALFIDRSISEAPKGPDGDGDDAYSPNPFDWWYMTTAGLDIGVAEAWRDLEIAGRLDNKVTIAVIDGGYAPSQDFPADTTGDNGVPDNGNICGELESPCAWHGHQVAAAAAAVPGNDFGTAGPGGPVANLMLLGYDGGMYAIIDEIYYAFEHDADIINLSTAWETDALVSWSIIPFEDATQEAREQGVLVFASAGNESRDVDAEDCFIVCWEEEWIAPCENDGVVCVGGLAPGGSRHPDSNWGYEWCGKAPCDVDIFGPMDVFLGADPTSPENEAYVVSGTSVASPFVAGVAALIWAANPALSDNGVEVLLKNWAHKSGDKQVARYVDARNSVHHALGENVDPFVEIDAPEHQSTVAYGGVNSVTFEATTADIEDGDDCCVVSWWSNIDGPLGVGNKIEAVFSDPGQRTITAKAIDADGASSTDTIDIAAENEPPIASIDEPISSNGIIYRGVLYKLNGEAVDPNDLSGVACSSFEWTSSNALDGSYVGCHPQITFPTTGTRTLKLTVTDAYGASGSDSVTVTAINPPLNSAPIVTITNPDDDASLNPDKLVKLTGTAVDPDGSTDLAYKWSVQDGGTVYPIGNTKTVWWKPSDDVPFQCGGNYVLLRMYATDDDGTGLDSVFVRVSYPPC